MYELAHLLAVTGQYHYHFAATVLRQGQDGVDGLLSHGVAIVLFQRICLVNEQHAAHRLVEY